MTCQDVKCNCSNARAARVFGINNLNIWQDAILCGVCVARLRDAGHMVSSGILATAQATSQG